MNWKIRRDSYYSDLYLKYGMDFISKAGFFEDDQKYDFNINDSINLMCTPYLYLKKELGNKPCILINTGSYAPFHTGHLNMMVCAKKRLEEEGYNVLGGYIAPSNDSYIKHKLNHQAIHINARIKLINDLIFNIDWLSIDPWMGLFRNCDVNFTEVIDRLRIYLLKHLGIDVPIFYVCGEDKGEFAYSFLHKGHCVVVNRKGEHTIENEFKSFAADHSVDINGRVLFSYDNTDFESSTNVRKNFSYTFEKKELIIRCDQHNKFEDDLVEIMQDYFTKVTRIDLNKQVIEMSKHSGNIISLDPLIPMEYNMGISRRHDFFGIKSLGYGERPGYPSFNEQIADIPKGEYYTLYDDDIVNGGGGTVRKAMAILESADIHIRDIITLNNSTKDQEILDSRDFRLDNTGGLVIDGKRYPYIYPWVDPYIRASVEYPTEFTNRIMELNINNLII